MFRSDNDTAVQVQMHYAVRALEGRGFAQLLSSCQEDYAGNIVCYPPFAPIAQKRSVTVSAVLFLRALIIVEFSIDT